MGEYPQAVAEARRLAGASRRVAQAHVPLVLEPDQAAALADAWLFETWSAREQARFTLPPSRLALEPGDIVELASGAGERLFRITEIGEHGAREITALSFDQDVYNTASTATRSPRLEPPPSVGQPIVEFLDLPLIDGGEPDTAVWLAATLTPWPGPVAFFRSPEQTGFTLATIATAAATFGLTLDELRAGPAGRLDKGGSVIVSVAGGTLASVTHLKMLAGANAAAVRHADGQWEIIQFEEASLVEAGTYRLSRLLRGQAGTEAAMANPLPAGSRFVLLNATVVRADLNSSEIGLPLVWRFGPQSRPIGHASYDARQHAFQGIGRRPLSPVHARGRRSGSDLTISWIRRTRRGGDSWDTVEVPLAEEREHYEVDILDGASVVRTLTTATPSATYTSAEQVEDFGAAQSRVTVAIHQTNDSFGRSRALMADV
jgi:hypothetical protein